MLICSSLVDFTLNLSLNEMNIFLSFPCCWHFELSWQTKYSDSLQQLWSQLFMGQNGSSHAVFRLYSRSLSTESPSGPLHLSPPLWGTWTPACQTRGRKIYLLLSVTTNTRRRHWVELNTARSPQVLTVEIPCTGAILPGSLILDVPGQKRHQVVGGAKAALTLNGLGQADSKEQSWPNTRTQTMKQSPYMIILSHDMQIH